MRMRQDINRYGVATGFLRTVAMSFKSCGMPARALQTVADDLKQSPALEALEAAKLAWQERLPEQPSTWLD